MTPHDTPAWYEYQEKAGEVKDEEGPFLYQSLWSFAMGLNYHTAVNLTVFALCAFTRYWEVA